MVHWFRVVLPSSKYRGLILAAFVLGPIGVAGAFGLTYRIELGTAIEELPQEANDVFEGLSLFFTGAACLLYGIYRAAYFHPVFRSEYAAWLANAPWNSTKPLPLGPIHLVLQDFLLLACAEFLAVFILGLPSLFVPLFFLVGYLLVLAVCFLLVEMDPYAFAVLYGLPGLVLLRSVPLAVAVGVAFLYLLAWRAIRSSLARFPWRSLGNPVGQSDPTTIFNGKRGDIQAGTVAAQMQRTEVGWPYASLCKRDAEPAFNYPLGIVWGALPGWLCLILFHVAKMEWADASDLRPAAALLFVVLALFRLAVYGVGFRPPISLAGRLRTGRFIIPDYDIVFLAPLTALLAGLGMLHGLPLLGAPPIICFPASLTIFLLLIINLGPSLSTWQLTGSYRLSPPVANQFLKRI